MCGNLKLQLHISPLGLGYFKLRIRDFIRLVGIQR